jgi:hypothetical protein
MIYVFPITLLHTAFLHEHVARFVALDTVLHLLRLGVVATRQLLHLLRRAVSDGIALAHSYFPVL